MNYRPILFVSALAGLLALIASRPAPVTDYRLNPAIPPVNAAAPAGQPVRSELQAGTAAAHSANLVRLPGGDVLAFWFAGSREGAGDVRIFGARLHNGAWSSPRPVMSIGQAMAGEWRFVRKLGNPVAVVDGGGRLHLFFVSVSLGGWATSQLNQMTSTDGGLSWSAPRLLVTSPFMNMSTLARTPAVLRSDGGFDLPVYHEGARKFPELLRFDAEGRNFRKVRMATRGALIQPAMVAIDGRNAIALLRDASPQRRLRALRSNDGGENWGELIDTDQINPDSAVALARLADGTLLLAFNPRNEGRRELALATSRDGIRWHKKRVIEDEAGGEFSYPTLLVAGDDDIHLVYTWQRKHIRHWRFTRSWLEQGDAVAEGATQ